MIDFPWDIVLAIAFTYTAVACAYGLIRGTPHEGAAASRFLDANHVLMSAAMISMVCWYEPGPFLWAQAGLFGFLGLAMLMLLNKRSDLDDYLEIGSHLCLNAAMVWMLVTMASMHTHAHHGHPMGGPPGGWSNVVSAVFVVLSAGGFFWWLYELAVTRRRRWHVACHVVMAAGTATMLVVMT